MTASEKEKLSRMARSLLSDEAFSHAMHQIEKAATEELISASTDEARRERAADVRSVRKIKSNLSVMAQWLQGK